jgi:hypothetical protein
MGTSSKNSGQRGYTPKIPRWSTEPERGAPPDDSIVDPGTGDLKGEDEFDANRFRQPRNLFTRFIKGGGKSVESAKKAIGVYVEETLGGSRNATLRIGLARKATEKLLLFIILFLQEGLDSIEKDLSVSEIAEESTILVLRLMMETICPDGGMTDEGIVRDAYVSTIEEMEQSLDIPFKDVSEKVLIFFLERFVTNLIFNRILNDIGNKITNLPETVESIHAVEQQIKTYLHDTVVEALAESQLDLSRISHDEIESVVRKIYQQTFKLLQHRGGLR